MSIGAVVVLYNPDNDVMDNIRTYLPIVGYLVAVDNSTYFSGIAKELASGNKSEAIDMGGNKGIATALNAGCSRLVELGCDIALTTVRILARFQFILSRGLIGVLLQTLGMHWLMPRATSPTYPAKTKRCKDEPLSDLQDGRDTLGNATRACKAPENTKSR